MLRKAYQAHCPISQRIPSHAFTVLSVLIELDGGRQHNAHQRR